MLKTEIAVFGGGCFWCLEAVFQQFKGVRAVKSGFAGGQVEDPTYIQVCEGNTGHAEVVWIDFNPDTISYEMLLEIFFEIHDPTTRDRQGADLGPQYRSIILTMSDRQTQQAQAMIGRLTRDQRYQSPILTEVKPLAAFYPAEFYHQDYYLNNSRQPYCQLMIWPKLIKMKEKYSRLLRSRRQKKLAGP